MTRRASSTCLGERMARPNQGMAGLLRRLAMRLRVAREADDLAVATCVPRGSVEVEECAAVASVDLQMLLDAGP